MSEVILHVLGTAQDAGIPHPNCFCENCVGAIQDPKKRRTAASLAIVFPNEKMWHLIDATPDLKEQMLNLQIKYQMQGKLMSSIFLTHAHLGHYPGLLFLGKESMNASQVPVMAGPKMKHLLEKQAPWRQLTDLRNIDIQEINDNVPVKVSSDLTVTPVSVPHRNEFSETFGFWIEGNEKKVLYIPDIDRWEQWNQDFFAACKEADICLLDGTFHSVKDFEAIGRDYRDIPHPLMTETMDRLQSLVKETEIYFIHLNHSNPAIDASQTVRDEIEKNGFRIAEEGMVFSL